jgi:beta-glucosidase/6-phospho-beta-glucosidase/beta-galactosidase
VGSGDIGVPTGRGRVNQPGIDHYSRLIDALLAGIAAANGLVDR